MSPRLEVSDAISIFFAAIRILIIDLPLFSLSLAFALQNEANHGLAIPELLQLFLIRRMNTLLSPRATRFVSDIGLPDKVLSSKRYGKYSHKLFTEVNVQPSHDSPAFRGRWIVRNSITAPKSSAPQDSDTVILYLHGGGYFSGSAATYLLFLLVLAEGIVRGGKSVSIFALEYDLAPEHSFPTQLRQARAAYQWLQGDLGVAKEHLLVMGDSAGGHLALSLLVDLWKPHHADAETPETQGSEKQDLKPGLGLVLLSPWLSLYHRPESFTRNAMLDVLSSDFLHNTALKFLGISYSSPWPNQSPSLEFLTPEPRVDWDAILPVWVWVSAGKNEILYDDIVRWIVERGGDCTGKSRIDGEVDRDEPHVYAWLKTVDPRLRKNVLTTDLEGEGSEDAGGKEFDAIERICRAILRRHEKVFGQ